MARISGLAEIDWTIDPEAYEALPCIGQVPYLVENTLPVKPVAGGYALTFLVRQTIPIPGNEEYGEFNEDGLVERALRHSPVSANELRLDTVLQAVFARLAREMKSPVSYWWEPYTCIYLTIHRVPNPPDDPRLFLTNLAENLTAWAKEAVGEPWEFNTFVRLLSHCLHTTRGSRTPECIDPMIMPDLAVLGGRYPNGINLLAHAATCNFCHPLFHDVWYALRIRTIMGKPYVA